MKVKRILKTIITIIFTFLSIYFISICFARNGNNRKYHTFTKSKTDYDVLFFGTSHVLNAIAPMQLWNEYGITSYNLGYHGCGIVKTYYLLQIALKYHKPKIAVFDIFTIDITSKTPEAELSHELGLFHETFDPFPLSKIKIDAINDIFSDTRNRMELYCPFYLYHNRWTEISPLEFVKDFGRKYIVYFKPFETKGMELRIGVKGDQSFIVPGKNSYIGQESIGMQYAKKIIEYCKAKDIIPVFMFIPYSAQESLFEWRNAFKKILEEENVSFCDMTNGIVNFDIDQYDLNSHLNPSGARKVTDMIGKFLIKNYDLETHKNELEFKNWESDYKRYVKYIQKKICEQNDFKNLLVMLNNDEVFAKIEAKNTVSFDQIEKELIFENTSEIVFEDNDNILSEIKVSIYSKEDKSLLCEKTF